MIGRAIAQIDLRLSRLGNKDSNRVTALLKFSICEQECFAGSCKLDVRPALFSQLQVDTCRCQVNQLVCRIAAYIDHQLIGEIVQHFLVFATDPARRLYVDILKNRIYVVFVFQPLGYLVKL